MSTLGLYRGIQVIETPPPVPGTGGAAIQGNFVKQVEWHPKSVWAQSGPPVPGVNNATEGQDFFAGSLWLDTNTTPPTIYLCLSSSSSTAQWVKLFTEGSNAAFAKLTLSGGNLLIGTTNDVSANGGKVLVFGDNAADPTFAASTWGIWARSTEGALPPSLRTNANDLRVDPGGSNQHAFVTLDRTGSGIAYLRIASSGALRWQLGMTAGESGSGGQAFGADFGLYAYNNDGTFRQTIFTTSRDTGATAFGKPITMSQGVTVTGGATVSGTTTLNNALTVTGAATLNGGATVSGTATLNNALTVTGTATLNGGANVTGNVGIGTSSPNSPLHVVGPIATAITTKTTNYTLTASDSVVLGDAPNGGIVITLPSAANIAGRRYTIKRISSGLTNTVTIDTTSSQTIDGAATKVLNTVNAFATVVSDGANWWIIG